MVKLKNVSSMILLTGVLCAILYTSSHAQDLALRLECPNPGNDTCNNLCNGEYQVAGGSLNIRWINDSFSSGAEVVSVDFYYSVAGGQFCGSNYCWKGKKTSCRNAFQF